MLKTGITFLHDSAIDKEYCAPAPQYAEQRASTWYGIREWHANWQAAIWGWGKEYYDKY